MKTFIYDPAHDRRESVLSYACDQVRDMGRKVVITVKEPTRNLESNACMWAMLADVARQVTWTINGKQQLLSAEDWKDIISASLKGEQSVALGINGGFVLLGVRTSKMTQREMGDMIEAIGAFGAENGVTWSEQAA